MTHCTSSNKPHFLVGLAPGPKPYRVASVSMDRRPFNCRDSRFPHCQTRSSKVGPLASVAQPGEVGRRRVPAEWRDWLVTISSAWLPTYLRHVDRTLLEGVGAVVGQKF